MNPISLSDNTDKSLAEKLFSVTEMAELCGVSRNTINRIILACNIEVTRTEVRGSAKTRLYSEESFKKVQLELGKNQLNQGRNSLPGSHVVKAAAKTSTSLTERDVEIISTIVSMTVAKTIEQLDTRLTKIENRIEERKALLPAPQIKPRDHINMLVREYAVKNNEVYSKIWADLYRQYSYRTNTNPVVCARNKMLSVMDYLESINDIETLESIAIDYLK